MNIIRKEIKCAKRTNNRKRGCWTLFNEIKYEIKNELMIKEKEIIFFGF